MLDLSPCLHGSAGLSASCAQYGEEELFLWTDCVNALCINSASSEAELGLLFGY